MQIKTLCNVFQVFGYVGKKAKQKLVRILITDLKIWQKQPKKGERDSYLCPFVGISKTGGGST